ncbi:MAG: DUF6115 domain-containing protein [Lachnospiraceae bacterium]|nr:DUF6115 domain-containing protein [Lachnospiraceae bacterium]
MTGLEIALFVLAVVFIVISFFITANNEKVDNNKAKAANVPDTKELQALSVRIINDVNKQAETVLQESEESMEKLSNEKIMAIDEYSGQVVEKIETNHREVVFLYQLLQDKEEELKATASKLDSARIKCEQLLRTIESENASAAIEAQAQAELDNRMRSAQTMQPAAGDINKPAKNTGRNTAENIQPLTVGFKDNTAGVDEITEVGKNTVFGQNTEPEKPAEPKKSASTAKRTGNPYMSKTKIEKPDLNDETGITEKNKEIIALYKKKKSVLEISKLLGMGQGEVRLIIDLYCKN